MSYWYSNDRTKPSTRQIDLEPFELKRIMNVDAISFSAVRSQMTEVPNSSEAILKKVMVPGDGVEIQKDGYYETHFTAFHAFSQIPFDATRARLSQPLSTHTVDLDTHLLEGYVAAIRTMTVGEKSIFWLPSELCFKDRGNPPKIPRNAAIYLYAELLGFEEGRPETGEEKIRKFYAEMAREKYWPDQAPVSYEGRDYSGDSSSVQNATDTMAEIPGTCAQEGEKKGQEETLADRYITLIQGYYDSGSYAKILDDWLEVFIVMPELEVNYKFWLTRGKACRMLARSKKNYDVAKAYLEIALELEPNDATIQEELEKLAGKCSTSAMATTASGSSTAASGRSAMALKRPRLRKFRKE